MIPPLAPPAGQNAFLVEGAIVGSQAVFRLTGELDIAGVARLDEVTAVARRKGARTLILDLSGLDQLVKTFVRQREMGRELILHRPSAPTMRLLQIAGLTDLITMAG